jgi:dolichol-phosphate mannosyltransferase
MAAPSLSQTCVVVPTYNERENIIPLIEGLRKAAPLARIIVVDDGSPDGTGDAADELAERFERFEVLHRPEKSGRGAACIAGFKAALSHPDVLCVVEMDADLSHDPGEVPGLVAALADADVAAGSRYLEGGGMVGRSPWRRLVSRAANAFARTLLRLPVRDCTNGLRAYSRAALERLDFSRIPARGFVVLIAVLDLLNRQGMRVREVPSVFVDRRRGKSNLGFKEAAEGFIAVLRLAARSRSV